MSPALNFKYVGQMCDGLFFNGGPILMKPARIIVDDNEVRFFVCGTSDYTKQSRNNINLSKIEFRIKHFFPFFSNQFRFYQMISSLTNCFYSGLYGFNTHSGC